MTKRPLFLSVLILSVVSSNTFSMLKKFTQPAQDALKTKFASTFNFSKIMPESLDTLIAHNKNNRNNAIVRLLCAIPLAAVAILLRIDMIGCKKDYHRYKAVTYQTVDHESSSLLFIASLAYAAKKGYTAYTRQWMIHHLQKVKNNSSNLLDQQFIKKITQNDIKNTISRAKVVPADKKTDATTVLNINNKETLAEVLSGKFNTSKHTLTTLQ